MKPLLVLALVVVAVGALLVGVYSLLGDQAPGTTAPEATVAEPAAAEPAGEAPTELVAGESSQRESAPTRPATATSEERTAASASAPDTFENELRGIVLDPEGQPLVEADVTLIPNGSAPLFFVNDRRDTSGQLRARTDKEGAFAFRNVEPGSHYSLAASHGEYTRKEVTNVQVGEVGEFVEPPIVLEKGARLAGTVRDTAGNMVPQAVLHLDGTFVTGILEPSPDRLTVRSDDAGAFAFDNVGKGARTLTVMAAGYGTKTIRGLNFNDKDEVQRDVELEAAEMICGRVVAENGQGVANAKVMAVGFSNTRESSQSVTSTDAQGAFCFEDLNPGLYTIALNLPGYKTSRAQRVETGTADVVIEVFKEASVLGQVVDDRTGQALTAFTLRLRFWYGPESPTAPVELSQDYANAANGEFVFPGVPVGEYVLEGNAPGYAPSFSTNFKVAQSQDVSGIVVRMSAGGGITGRVVDSAGQPVPRARVSTHDNTWTDDAFTRALGAQFPTNATSAETRTDGEGRFALSGLNPERYQVRIEAPGFTAAARADVVVTDGQETSMGDVELSRGGTLRGTAFDPAGQPLAGAKVTLDPTKADGVPTPYFGKSRADGTYTITNIVPGTYKLSASRSSAADVNIFEAMADEKHSQVLVTVAEGEETVQNVRIGE